MKLAVVIPNWNSIDFIEDCLQSLQRQTQPHTVIVADNGSVDGSMELIRDKYPTVQLHSFPDNTGFTGGVNRGIKPALEQGFEAIVLFNNDAVAEPDWLERLAAAAQAYPKAGIITSKIRHLSDSKLDSTGDFYSIWGFPFPRGRDETDHGQYDAPEQQVVFAGSGGASLYRAELFRQIGLFDQRFFAYFEDTDLSFRAHLTGWEVRYEPSAVVRHRISATSSRMKNNFGRYQTVKNFIYVYTKNMPGYLYWKYLPLAIAAYGLMFVSDLRRRQLGTFFHSSLTALVHLPGILVDRWHIQRMRTVTPAAIDRLLYHDLPPLQKLRFRRFHKASSAK